MGKRKRYTAEEKIQILREVLEEGKPVSRAAEQYSVPPNNIFKWKKQLFEDGVQTFQIQRKDINAKADERKITVLEQRLKQKDEIIENERFILLCRQPVAVAVLPCNRLFFLH